VQNTRDIVAFYRGWETGGGDQSNLDNLVTQLSISFGVFAVFIWFGVVAFDWARRQRYTEIETRILTLSALLLVASAAHFFWWLVLNDAGWIRHALPGVMYLAVAGVVLASRLQFPVARLATAGVVGVLLITQADAMTDVEPVIGKEDRLVALLDTSDYLNETESADVSFWGCGWWANRDLDLVSEVKFYDCLDEASVRRHLDAGEQLLLVRSEYYNWEGSPVLASLAEDCDTRKLFAAGPFSVCDATPWLRANTPRPG
jgi:hypothetical protein